MTGISTNALQIAKRFRKRREKLDVAIRTGLKKAAAHVDAAQAQNLAGSGPPGSYPVPVRSGHLLGGHFFNVISNHLAIVGNTTVYAAAIHEDRPFLDDAVEQTDVAGIMAIEFRKAVFAV